RAERPQSDHQKERLQIAVPKRIDHQTPPLRDDIKLYDRNEPDIDSLIHITRLYSNRKHFNPKAPLKLKDDAVPTVIKPPPQATCMTSVNPRSADADEEAQESRPTRGARWEAHLKSQMELIMETYGKSVAEPEDTMTDQESCAGVLCIACCMCQDVSQHAKPNPFDHKGCYKKSTWQSQPYIGPYPAGNILLSASLLFAGATATTCLRVLTHMNIASISGRTFFRHQSSILQPAVQRVWKKEQRELFAVLMTEDRKLVLGGDGRADSPGHSAKYGTYTALEVPSNVIIDIQQVQECVITL
ncbi:hypothetical protein JOQ06_012506, partial [Pogonophryne albipinna]